MAFWKYALIPLLLTILVVIFAIVLFFLFPDMQTRSQVGDFVAGIAAAVAFVWLIAAYFQQGAELRNQRKELELQRQTLNLQREELNKMGKYAALGQISHLMHQFELSLRDEPVGNLRTSSICQLHFSVVWPSGRVFWSPLIQHKFNLYMLNGPP